MIGRKGVFLVGLGSGVFIASRWRSVVKRGIKMAVKGGAKAQRIVARGAENISDLTAEALAEMGAPELERAGTTALRAAPAPRADPADASAETPG